MSTNAYPEPVVVANALSRLSDAVDRALAWLPYPGLISPDYREFSLRPDSRSDLALTVPVMVAPGVLVQLVAPFPATSSDEFQMVKKIRDRFYALLDKLDATLALRSDYEQAARVMFEPEAHGRLLAVRLAPIDLATDDHPSLFEVQVAGDANEMLCPFREEWSVCDLGDLRFYFDQFQRDQGRRVPLRKRAHALGAVGFIDPLALALAERLPFGQRIALSDVARREFHMWEMSSVARCDTIKLEWWDGIVRGHGYLSEHLLVSGDHLDLRMPISEEAAVGRMLGDCADVPQLANFRIASLTPLSGDRARIALDTRPVPFTADGQVLAAD